MNSSPTPGQTESPQLHRLGVAAAEDLRKTVRAALNELLGAFLRQLPAGLQDAAAKATNPSDRNTLQELARSLPAQSARWIETFIRQVDTRMVGGVTPAGDAAFAAPAGDDSVAMAGVELRAEERYQKLITELDARFNRIGLMLYVPIYSKALAPAGLCRALQETADAVNWPVRQRRLLLEQFDARVIPALERLYRALIDALMRIGTEAAKVTADSAGQPGPRKPAARTAQIPAALQAPADRTQLDDETRAMLQGLALKSDGAGYTDGLLAADLLALADNKPLPGVAKDQSWIPLQRITLAGHFLNVVISDAMVPDEMKSHHESVRFPLMKSALTDDTLFTSSSHPLASLIHELLLKSATSRVTGNAETRRMAELLQQVLVQFDLAPEFVRQAMRSSRGINESQIQRFFEFQRQQAQQRRDFVIGEAKRVVVRQLEQSVFGREIPAPALRFLNTAWGPLLTRRLLQHGANHALWKGALDLMEQLLDQLEARKPGEPPSSQWKNLLLQLGRALASEGMAEPRVKEALASLEASRLTAAVPLAAGLG